MTVALLVGPILTLVNQSEAVFGLAALDLGKAAATFFIPFLVSGVSGALALLQAKRAARRRHEELVRSIAPAIADIDLIRSNAEGVNLTARARYRQTKALLEIARYAVAEIKGSSVLIQDALAQAAEVRSHFGELVATELQVQQDIRNSSSIAGQVNASVEKTRGRFSEIALLSTDIGRLSHQTTLLSLNAAVVAATSGTEGRRLAAIADSVRELARKIDAHAKKISGTMVELEELAMDMATQSDDLGKATERLQLSSVASKAALARAECSMEKSAASTNASMDLIERQSTQIREVVDGIVSVVDHAEAAIAGSAKNMELAKAVGFALRDIARDSEATDLNLCQLTDGTVAGLEAGRA